MLKGGTAINFTIFNLPRLSVDIDLDFSFDGTKEEMLTKRNEITLVIRRYMEINGYIFHENTKNMYALDSFVFGYINNFGNKDNIKVEINYMNRKHIFKPVIKSIAIDFLNSFEVLTLNKYELFGSKIKALIERCTIRDVYDVYHMIQHNLFNKNEYLTIKRCIIFYIAIGSTTERLFEEIISDFDNKINVYMLDRIPQYLSSTLKKDDVFNIKIAVTSVKRFINSILELSETERSFLDEFYKGNYQPQLLFFEEEILNRIIEHPMALWKTQKNKPAN